MYLTKTLNHCDKQNKLECNKCHSYIYRSGPWTVHSKVNDVVFRILPDPSWQRKNPEVVSIDRLKIYHENEDDPRQSHPPPRSLDLSLKDDEFCETLEAEEGEEDAAVGEVPMDFEEGAGQPGPAGGPEPMAEVGQPEGDQTVEEVPVDQIGPGPPGTEPPQNLPLPDNQLTAQARKAQQLAQEAERAFGTLPQGRRRQK